MWFTSNIFSRMTSLTVNGVEVAAIYNSKEEGFIWAITHKKVLHYSRSLELAQQAAEEALADAGSDGFSWEEVEPKYIAYEVSRICSDGSYDRLHTNDSARASGIYDDYKSLGSTKIAALWAQDENLNWHELDRCEAGDDE